VVALKRASEMVVTSAWLTRSARACFLRPGFFSGNVRPCWHSQHTVAQCYHCCSFPSDCMCQELAKSCVLILLTFHLPHSMRHSERCEARSKCVISVTVHILRSFVYLSPCLLCLTVFWVIEQTPMECAV